VVKLYQLYPDKVKRDTLQALLVQALTQPQQQAFALASFMIPDKIVRPLLSSALCSRLLSSLVLCSRL